MEASRRRIKKEIAAKVKQLSLYAFLEDVKKYPKKPLLHVLFFCLCSSDEKEKWYAVSAFGQVMAQLADEDMEQARVIMRRFMWMLNDESGGIGWGVPEAFAETLACHKGLAEEYTHILVSFMRHDGFYLELESLQRGLIWGIGRLAQSRPQLLLDKEAVQYLQPYLESNDVTVRGLATQAISLLTQ